MPEDRKRSHPATVDNRILRYPEEWRDGRYRVAERSEDFPGITREAFVQDLHNLARRLTTQAVSRGEELGWVARTSVRGLPPGEVEFSFLRLPLAECPTVRERRSRAAGARQSERPWGPAEQRAAAEAAGYCLCRAGNGGAQHAAGTHGCPAPFDLSTDAGAAHEALNAALGRPGAAGVTAIDDRAGPGRPAAGQAAFPAPGQLP
jgi:hypothetical protein